MEKKETNLLSDQPLTYLSKSYQLNTWEALLHFVKHLPYGRNSNREDFSLVLKEEKGSCSSKNAFLKAVALENNLKNVNLVLAIFKMNARNTPVLASILEQHNFTYIPEAHCYLKIGNDFIDVTNPESNYCNFKNDIIETQFILPNQVIKHKVYYHKTWIRTWLKDSKSNFSFEEFWAMRENCISILSK